MFHSSIFGFDTLRVRWRIPRCVIFACICLVLAEVLIARTNFIWGLFSHSGLGTVFALERSFIQKDSKPSVLIFGSSSARAAFLPTQMEEQMGLQRGEVLNLAISRGQPFGFLNIYERNRRILAQADSVIIEVQSWQFSRGVHPSPLYRFFGGWSDRMAYRGANRLSLMRHLLFRLPDVIPYFQGYVRRWIREGQRPRPISKDKYGRLAMDSIDDYHDENNFKPQAIMYWINRFYSNYEYSNVFEGHLKKLVKLVKEDGGKVYVVRIPAAEKYMAMLTQYDGDPLGKFRKKIIRAVGERVNGGHFREFTSEEANLSDWDFRDWGHMNNRGAIKWTKYFVRWLKQSSSLRGA